MQRSGNSNQKVRTTQTHTDSFVGPIIKMLICASVAKKQAADRNLLSATKLETRIRKQDTRLETKTSESVVEYSVFDKLELTTKVNTLQPFEEV